jgi:hypothetical protein
MIFHIFDFFRRILSQFSEKPEVVRQRAAATKRPRPTGKKRRAATHGAATKTVTGSNAPAQKPRKKK